MLVDIFACLRLHLEGGILHILVIGNPIMSYFLNVIWAFTYLKNDIASRLVARRLFVLCRAISQFSFNFRSLLKQKTCLSFIFVNRTKH